jgi:hypothetical protein
MAKRDELRQRGGVQLRLLICGTCRTVWPTERDEAHGGSRSDGEPCAYRWRDGRVCDGTVHPMYGQRPNGQPAAGGNSGAAYSGGWCKVLGVPWGTRDLALVRKRYRELAKAAHPDVGGDHAQMVELNEAYRQALSELGQP